MISVPLCIYPVVRFPGQMVRNQNFDCWKTLVKGLEDRVKIFQIIRTKTERWKIWRTEKWRRGSSQGTQYLTDRSPIKKDQRKPRENTSKQCEKMSQGQREEQFPDYSKYHSGLISPKHHYEIWEHWDEKQSEKFNDRKQRWI